MQGLDKNNQDIHYQEMFAEYKAYDGNEPYVFLSYSHADFEEVKYFLELLKKNHFRFWFDEGIKSGSEWADEISQRIRNCVQFVVFISSNSIESSNVKDEVHIAVKYGIEIIRIHLDETELNGGLELQLDRRQALYRHKYKLMDFEDRFCAALSIKTVYSESDISQIAQKNLYERYEINECIGKGGTAKVYLAKSKSTGTMVVVKSATIANSQVGDNIKEYFNIERKVLSKRISCFAPHIYDSYADSTSVYLVENFIEGVSLNEMKKITVYELIKIIIEIAKILKRYHENGIVHCDVKPKHIICNKEGCFLIDFGASKDIDDEERQYIMGTPGYAAPEQLSTYIDKKDIYGNTTLLLGNEGHIDNRTDIFGLGRTLKRMLRKIMSKEDNLAEDIQTGVLFNLMEQDGLNGTDYNNTSSDSFDCEKNNIFFNIPDPLLHAIVDKMTMHKKEDRFNSMDEVIQVLNDYLKLQDIHRQQTEPMLF